MSRIQVGALVGPLLLAATLSYAEVHVNLYVPTGPPVAIVETRPASPGAGYVWVGGYHRWDGNAYAWERGHWDQPPTGHRAWAAGRWQHHPKNGWYWTDGRWR
jgi:hypothetical protein